MPTPVQPRFKRPSSTITLYECRDSSGNVHFWSGILSAAAAYADSWNPHVKRGERLKLVEQRYRRVGSGEVVRVAKPAGRKAVRA